MTPGYHERTIPPVIAKTAMMRVGSRTSATLNLFWERVDWLIDQAGPALNHHRDPRFVAYLLSEVESRCAHARLSLPPISELRAALRLDPRLVGNRAVNSPSGKTMQCWVFTADGGSNADHL